MGGWDELCQLCSRFYSLPAPQKCNGLHIVNIPAAWLTSSQAVWESGAASRLLTAAVMTECTTQTVCVLFIFLLCTISCNLWLSLCVCEYMHAVPGCVYLRVWALLQVFRACSGCLVSVFMCMCVLPPLCLHARLCFWYRFNSENRVGGVKEGCLSLAECSSTFLLVGP